MLQPFTNPTKLFPQVVFAPPPTTGQTTTVPFTTIVTTTATGWYSLAGWMITNTDSSTAWSIQIDARFTPPGSIGVQNFTLFTLNMETGSTGSGETPVVAFLPAGTVISAEIVTVSGSNTGGVYSYGYVIERFA
jgi:hypothetical protein